MSTQNPYAKYRQSQLASTPKLKLIVMLYDGAVRFLLQSIPAMENAEFEKKGEMINKAIDILFHLTGTLDYDLGGDLAVNLCRCYDFLINRLVEANRLNDPLIVNEVISHLRELRASWNTVSRGLEEGNQPQTPTVPKHLSDLSMAA